MNGPARLLPLLLCWLIELHCAPGIRFQVEKVNSPPNVYYLYNSVYSDYKHVCF